MDHSPLPSHLDAVFDAMTIKGATDRETAQLAVLNMRVLTILARDLDGLLAFGPAPGPGDMEVPLTLDVPPGSLSNQEITLVAPLLAREIAAKVLEMAPIVMQGGKDRRPLEFPTVGVMESAGLHVKWLLGSERVRLQFAEELSVPTTWTQTTVGWRLRTELFRGARHSRRDGRTILSVVPTSATLRPTSVSWAATF